MNINISGRPWFAVVVICLIVAIFVGVGFILYGFLPDTKMAAEVTETIQSVVTVIAILAGGYFAFSRLQIFRTFEPHLTISHRVSHRRLSDSYMHIDATAVLQNNSKVQIELREGFVLLQGISPVSDEEAESLYAGTSEDGGYENLQWPVLEDIERVWGESRLVVEPGESHAETFEFIIGVSDYQSVLIYTYFYNPRASKSRGSAKGWGATTVYDMLIGR